MRPLARRVAPPAALLAALLCLSLSARHPAAQGAGPQPGERQAFQKVLLVQPDDKDYVVLKVPDGARAVVTDVIAYNAADGKGHKPGSGAEAYLWIGGYAEGKSVGVINRMRVLGTETEQWHAQTGWELRGAPELLVSNEKGSATASPVLVHVNGYLTR